MTRLFAGLVLAALACLTIGGCQSIKDAYDTASAVTITQQTIDTTMAAYDSAFLAPAQAYRKLYDTNPCPAGAHASAGNVCAERAIVVRLQEVDKAVEAALADTQAQLDACKAAGQSGCSGLGAAYTALQTAITAARSAATALGVI
ncbi:MAG: hypothetical protein ACTHJ3_07770 [Pararhizobium sp.]